MKLQSITEKLQCLGKAPAGWLTIGAGALVILPILLSIGCPLHTQLRALDDSSDTEIQEHSGDPAGAGGSPPSREDPVDDCPPYCGKEPLDVSRAGPIMASSPGQLIGVGVSASGVARTTSRRVPPEIVTAAGSETCSAACQTGCVARHADQVFVVLPQPNAAGGFLRGAYQQAVAHLQQRCGKESVVEFIEPDKGDLLESVRRHADQIVGFVFIGHGQPQGLTVSDTSFISEQDLQDALSGASLPHVQLYACDQGEQSGHHWGQATRARELVHFDGRGYAPDIRDKYIQLVKRIPCSVEKHVCTTP